MTISRARYVALSAAMLIPQFADGQVTSRIEAGGLHTDASGQAAIPTNIWRVAPTVGIKGTRGTLNMSSSAWLENQSWQLVDGSIGGTLVAPTIYGVRAELIGHASRTVDFVDHFRGEGFEFDYTWEERWIRDEGYNKIVPAALADLFKSTGANPADVAHFAMPCVLPRVAAGIAKRAGIPDAAVRDNLHAVCGETGAAHPLVMLVDALEKARPGDKILVAGFGQGCDAILFEATDELPKLAPRLGVKGHLARRKDETNYAKFQAFNDLVAIERGLRADIDKQTPLSSLYRNRRMLTGLIGGQCRKCGTVQFPKSNVCVNPNCNAFHTQDDHAFADIPAKVQSYTADRLTYSPDPPHYYGMVVFQEGGRFLADFTDCDAASVDVATPMRMMFRIKDYDPARGFTRYFWKAAPN